jgi:hypothetical protein
MRDPSPASPCSPQIWLHGLGVGIIVCNEPPQVLEHFHLFQFFPVRRKRTFEGLLGMHGSRMLPFSLPWCPPLRSPTRVCNPQRLHFGRGWERMQTRSWGCRIRKWWPRLNLVPDCLPHCHQHYCQHCLWGYCPHSFCGTVLILIPQ